MTTQELWKAGRLEDAIVAQTADVKANPTDAERRYLLFALLCYDGNLERADRQLDALGVQDPKLQAGTSIYRNLLASEAERRRVFEEDMRPLVPPDAPSTIEDRLAAIRADRQGQSQSEVIARIRGSEISCAGKCGADSFDGIQDLDEFLGPTLEIFAGGRYLWMPFASIRHLTIQEPSHLLDLLWIPAQLEDVEGTEADVHLPALYAGSHTSEQDGIRLGRVTEWEDRGGVFRGHGQKLLQLSNEGDAEGEGDRPILMIRSLQVEATAGASD